MKKRNSLNYGIVNALFDTSAESENGGSYFKVFGNEEPETLNIPTSIMHRLYRLGQAYGIRQLRYFESECKILVGSNEIKEFIKDLEKLRVLLNDEVLHKYIDILLDSLSKPSVKTKHIAVSTGNYFR